MSGGLTEGKKRLLERIEVDFAAHEVSAERAAEMAAVRSELRLLAQMLVAYVPEGRELSQALSALELVMFHANAGIARHGG